ncbi:MAG: endopeptidase La [Eubacteriales bacterium]
MSENNAMLLEIEEKQGKRVENIPVLALRGLVVFNGIHIHFDVGRERSVKSLEQAMREGQNIFLVAQKQLSTDNPGKDDLFQVGTMARIKQILRMPGDNMRVLVEGISRGILEELTGQTPCLRGNITLVDEVPVDEESVEAMAYVSTLRDAFDEYCAYQNRSGNDIILKVMDCNHPGRLADLICANIALRMEDKQEILAEFDPYVRAEKLTVFLKREIDVMEVEASVAKRVKEQIDKNQREYVLREQLKAIQIELDEGDGIQKECEAFTQRIMDLKLPEEIQEKLLKEVDRLSRTSQGSSEGMVIRTYLDTVLSIPWSTTTRDRLSVPKARKLLDAEHYGMEKVKEQILEFLAVKQLNRDLKGQILCLVGPPGVGKTSIGHSVAEAMGRKFVRLSLGGVRDEADIRGHRKTYIGAMPGRIISALIQSGSRNCVMMLDEVDKMASDFRGDPAAALLEAFDGEQNVAFRDHYVELPVDLSDVLFIVTANTLDTIPRPLLDRMEVIELGSYTQEEKVHIARKHLLPKVMKKHGLERRSLSISDDAINAIIEGYTRESGVRNLERALAKVCRKAAVRMVEDGVSRVSVTRKNLHDYLGVIKYLPDATCKEDEVGVVCGLAWTQVGGDILYVEVNVMKGSGKIELTGSLGDVMKESAHAAISYIRSRCSQLGIDEEFYKNNDIHIHFPQGAIPKDGPSAGITMATAIVSALTGTPVLHDVAMTGEVTIRGRVLAIGGLKEKTMAAYKHGMKTVIIPRENQRDLEEIDPAVREHVRFVTASNMDEVLAVALAPVEKGNQYLPSKSEKKELPDAGNSYHGERDKQPSGRIAQ